MRLRFTVGSIVLALIGLGAPAQAATAPVTSVRLNEVSCEPGWVEIVNTHPTLVANLGGWVLSDKAPGKADPTKTYVFPAGTRLAPRALLVVDALPFVVTCGAGEVFLAASSSTSVAEQVVVPNLAMGYTWARVGNAFVPALPTARSVNFAAPADATIDRASWLFDPAREVRINLTMDPADMAKLAADPSTYVAATFTAVNALGERLPTSGALTIGVKEKGHEGSRTGARFGPGGLTIVDDKVGLKLKFNHSVKGQTFFGLKKLTLNNMVQDATMAHEVATYELFRAFGIPAPRTGFVNLYVNGQLRGLYLNVETYDEIMLAWSTPPVAHLYDAQGVYTDASKTQYVPSEISPASVALGFEVDMGDEQDRSDLAALADALQPEGGLSAAAKALIDVDEVARYFAVEKYVNHLDGYSGTLLNYPANYYLLRPEGGKFTMLPWGTDQAWSAYTQAYADPVHVEPFDKANGLLFNRCLADDYCASVYRRTLAQLPAVAEHIDDRMWLLMVQHRASRIADPLRLNVEADTFQTYDQSKLVALGRPALVKAYLDAVVTGAIRWKPVSLKLKRGTAFTAAHLNAYTDIPGTITYSVKPGKVLKPGKYAVTAQFTPADPLLMAKSKRLVFTVK